MSGDRDIAFAELLCARLCHDMAGAVGAAAAGAELLEEGFDLETAQLVATSAAGAVARLKFFRAALGPAGSEQPATAIHDLAQAYLRAADPGLTLRWTSRSPQLDGETARLVLNLILVARDSLPRGGEIAVKLAPEESSGPTGIMVGFHGAGGRLGDETEAALLGGERPFGPRGAQASFTRRLVDGSGRFLSFERHGDGGVLGA